MASNLVLFSKLDNPFSGPNPTKFQRIHKAYGLMARRLVSAHGKVDMRRPRWMNSACGVIAMVENFVVGAVGEEGSVAQLDAAARGAFALDRDFDTMSRMVRRLHDEVEHGRDVIRLFMEDGDMDGGWMMLREVVRELQLSDGIASWISRQSWRSMSTCASLTLTGRGGWCWRRCLFINDTRLIW